MTDREIMLMFIKAKRQIVTGLCVANRTIYDRGHVCYSICYKSYERYIALFLLGIITFLVVFPIHTFCFGSPVRTNCIFTVT